MLVCKDLAMTNTARLRTGLILALGLLVSPVMLGAEIIEQILVKVNGEIFTKTDLETRQVQAMRQRGIQLDPKSDPTDAQLRQALNTVTPQVMVEAVSEMLLVQRAKELGYKLADEQFKQIVDNIRKENKLDTDEKFQAALKQENMTVADLRRQVERSILVQRVESVEVFGKVAIYRGRGAPLLRRAPRGVHHAGGGHAARDSRGRAGRQAPTPLRTRPPGPRPTRSAPVPRPARTT